MAMGIFSMKYVRCDFCGDPHGRDGESSAREARAIAKAEGWRRKNGKDICPACWDKEGAER